MRLYTLPSSAPTWCDFISVSVKLAIRRQHRRQQLHPAQPRTFFLKKSRCELKPLKTMLLINKPAEMKWMLLVKFKKLQRINNLQQHRGFSVSATLESKKSRETWGFSLSSHLFSFVFQSQNYYCYLLKFTFGVWKIKILYEKKSDLCKKHSKYVFF